MWYHKKTAELYGELNSSAQGLSTAEAEKRLSQYSENLLVSEKKKSFIKRYFESLCDRMTLILLIAAVISGVTGYISGEGFADPIIILIIVFANALIAVVQDMRAENALNALKKMTSPENYVLRDGKKQRIPSRLIVPGDIILLEKGDIVPCDARLIDSNELTVDESALTGESVAVEKSHRADSVSGCLMSESKNSVFTSSHIVSGRGAALAVKTGMSTCVGEIADMINVDNEQTPLQKRLAKLSNLLGNVTIGICVVIFGFSVLRGLDIGEMFITSVSLSVAAIPEGLPAIVTVVLSAGVQSMARRKAVVKRLPAVETLGCAQIICSDKTGTLTCNKMTVMQTFGDEHRISTAAALCNNDSSPTELALTEYARKHLHLRDDCPRVAEIPFDSVKKYMVTVNRFADGYTAFIKGAPDVVLKKCKNADIAAIELQISKMAKNALRVICFAKCELSHLPRRADECDFEFVGLCGISDPPREESREAVAVCKKAGIRPIMITGDHKDTAYAVALAIGIIEKDGLVMTESELGDLSEREFLRVIEKCNVYARVTPSFKLRVVSALKSKGYVVAMTGDGVNDAPALKKADIGCAMGISGTEVAKESADMILTDDNFSTIVTAVREGRGIYENIRRAVHFLLSCNIGELFTVFFSIIMSLPNPLSAIQLLWVNLTTDSLPAIALGLERADDSLMQKPPIKADSPLFSAERVFRIVFEGILIGVLAVSAFVIGSNMRSVTVGSTMCFFVLGASQLFHSFNMQSEKSIFARRKQKNVFVFVSFVVCLCMQICSISIPFFANLFSVVALNATEWIICFALSLCPVATSEIYKRFKK